MWDEYVQTYHPAWSECPEDEDTQRRVGEMEGITVGAARMTSMPPTLDIGIRNFLHSEVLQVVAGHLVSTEVVFTGTFEMVETIRFSDHPSSGTFVELSAWCNTAPFSEARAAQLQRNLGRIQQGYLQRAQSWTPGTGHRPNILKPEPEDLRFWA